MKYNPDDHHHRSVRLRGYDYASAGAYFVTFITHERELLFGEVADGAMVMNDTGLIAKQEWLQTANARPYVELDAFVVMPDHVHGIVVITRDPSTPRDVGARRAVPWAQPVNPRPQGTLRPYINSEIPSPAHSRPSSARTNPPRPGASTRGAARPAPRCGREIITSISSATNANWIACARISKTIH